MNSLSKPRIWKTGRYWYCATFLFMWYENRAIDYVCLDEIGHGERPDLAYLHWFKINHAFN